MAIGLVSTPSTPLIFYSSDIHLFHLYVKSTIRPAPIFFIFSFFQSNLLLDVHPFLCHTHLFFIVFYIIAFYSISNQISRSSNTHYFLSVSLISYLCDAHLFFKVFHITAFFSISNQISRLSDTYYFLFVSLIYHLLYTHFFPSSNLPLVKHP